MCIGWNLYKPNYKRRPVKPCTHDASDLLAIHLQLDVRIACDGLQQKCQHAERFTCDPLIAQTIFVRFSNGVHHSSQNFMSFHKILHIL